MAEMKRQKRVEEEERAKVKDAARAVQEKKRLEMVIKWRREQAIIAERERVRMEQQHEAETQQERQRLEAEEADRVRRIPVVCQSCHGGGKCEECKGTGVFDALFLAPRVKDSALEFGSKRRGCVNCFGCDQGIRGPLMEGTGTCITCGGIGKFCTGFCLKSMARRLPASPSTRKTKDQEDTAELVSEACPRCGGAVRPSLQAARREWAGKGLAPC